MAADSFLLQNSNIESISISKSIYSSFVKVSSSVRGVLWKPPPPTDDHESSFSPLVFRLSHGGNVDSDGNCLFTASQKEMAVVGVIDGDEVDSRELRRRTVRRFPEDLGSANDEDREMGKSAIMHMYSPDLKSGWGIHVVQEVNLLAKKSDRESMDSAIAELLNLGMQSSLDEVKLKEKGRTFHDLFLTKLSLLLKGSIVAPPDKFGETLQDEKVNGGALMGADGLQSPQKLIPVHVQESKSNGIYLNDVQLNISGKVSRTLSWWCFNPGIAMEDFSRKRVGSIILTSGTLSPMDSFAQELKL